jgi:hypothetical protein
MQRSRRRFGRFGLGSGLLLAAGAALHRQAAAVRAGEIPPVPSTSRPVDDTLIHPATGQRLHTRPYHPAGGADLSGYPHNTEPPPLAGSEQERLNTAMTEVPNYLEICPGQYAFAIHGPRPADIGRPREVKREHGFVIELVHNGAQIIRIGGMIDLFEATFNPGAEIWYIKSWFKAGLGSILFQTPAIFVSGKLIFVQRPLPDGDPSAACTSFDTNGTRIAGYPSSFTVEKIGSSTAEGLPSTFTRQSVIIDTAPFNKCYFTKSPHLVPRLPGGDATSTDWPRRDDGNYPRDDAACLCTSPPQAPSACLYGSGDETWTCGEPGAPC